MKKLRSSIAVAVVAASALIASSAAIATASRPVSGSLEGSAASSAETFCATGTMSVTGSFDATFIGSGTFVGTITTSACLFPPFCCGVPSEPYPVDATFVFAGPGGTFTASGSGTGVSTAFPHFDSDEFDVQLTIESGTKRYQRASGTLSMNLDVTGPLPDDLTTVATGTITGAITPA